jgi:hypothetical protein
MLLFLPAIQFLFMINLRKFFQPDPCLLSVTRSQKEILECFLSGKKEFENWLLLQPSQRVRFQFYVPTAIDFCFDEFKLFTAYFKKGSTGLNELAELRMSKDNYNTLRVLSWKPFEEVMFSFLSTQEETNKATLFQKTRSLHEYAAICKKTPSPHLQQNPYSREAGQTVAAG